MNFSFKRSLIAATIVTSAMVASQVTIADVPESKDPIKIAVNEWTGQHLSANITAELLKKKGYNVELVTAGGLSQLTAIAQGEIHLNPELWDNSITDAYTNAVASGDILVRGSLGLKPQEGWIYPKYMKEKCPGLPNYQALYDCAQSFANAETYPKGRLITYPADWGTRSKDVVASIDLPFVAVAGGSEGAMVAELKSALAAKEPILMMFWQPHWLFAEIDVDWVTWNPIEGECVEETQNRNTACGFAQANAVKIESKMVAQKWPEASELFKKIKISNEEQNRMILAVDQKKRPLSEVVDEWMIQNKSKWSEWVK
ncbi:ABC transporter substrate-binding protein [Kiloniella antarctica]|uniref:ABC transporter substrate-binding protein n=1 Tax=Kiloniella antarctica TaxID=1550907 RepID=A0ABW5BNN1_9PROT